MFDVYIKRVLESSDVLFVFIIYFFYSVTFSLARCFFFFFFFVVINILFILMTSCFMKLSIYCYRETKFIVSSL